MCVCRVKLSFQRLPCDDLVNWRNVPSVAFCVEFYTWLF